MKSEKKFQPADASANRAGEFRIEGLVQLEQKDCAPNIPKLRAFAFNQVGVLLGSDDVSEKGGFNIRFAMRQPTDIELFIGPDDEPQTIRKSSAFSRHYSAKEWQLENDTFVIRPELALPFEIWRLWWPLHLCISGHVRKVETNEGSPTACPVPFVKVEIFDVDREGCWWPPLLERLPDLFDRPVLRIPDLLRNVPIPPLPPIPPGPFPPRPPFGEFSANIAERVGLNPQPLPPRSEAGATPYRLSSEAFTLAQRFTGRVGEVAALPEATAARLEKLTLTSRIAPWLIFPFCFYSRQLICETTTDCNGFFRCCFNWWPFHFRNGRLRFDSRPDIIIRVTQIINGVETVIYLDPYTSTRWNVSSAHIDLFLDDEDVRCGNVCTPQPEGTTTFYTLVGHDQVYKIDQGTGKFSNIAFGGSLSNWAYGGGLRIYGVFGEALSAGAPKRYYRLTHIKGAEAKPIQAVLQDTRVDQNTLLSELYTLGPVTVNGVPNLYEIRDTDKYYWYDLGLLGHWNTLATESDTGLYTLRLEVFDENGSKLDSNVVDYRDGTVAPPNALPPMVDACDLNILLDNKKPEIDIEVPAAINECGVVPFASASTLSLIAKVNQENGRLYHWDLSYRKGLSGTPIALASDVNDAGLAVPVNQAVSGAPLVSGLTSTCAFALKLYAYPLIRNGISVIHYEEIIKAIAIEKCA